MSTKWSLNSQNNIMWSIEAKLFLIRQIRENMIVLKKDYSPKTIETREKAWHRIYKSCIKSGMPDCPIDRLKKFWVKMKSKSKLCVEKYKTHREKGKKITEFPTVIDTAIGELLEHYRATNNFAIPMPKPLNGLKKPKNDATLNEDVKPQRRIMRSCSVAVRSTTQNQATQQKTMENFQLHSARPIVVLNKISDSIPNKIGNTEIPPPTSEANNNNINVNQNTSTSSKLMKIQEEIAVNELKYKQAMRENEEERMEFEREIFRKQIMLLDLKIKKNNLQINYYVKGGN